MTNMRTPFSQYHFTMDLVAILDVAKNRSSVVFHSWHLRHLELADKKLKNPPGCFQYRDIFLVCTGNSHSCITSQVQTCLIIIFTELFWCNVTLNVRTCLLLYHTELKMFKDCWYLFSLFKGNNENIKQVHLKNTHICFYSVQIMWYYDLEIGLAMRQTVYLTYSDKQASRLVSRQQDH